MTCTPFRIKLRHDNGGLFRFTAVLPFPTNRDKECLKSVEMELVVVELVLCLTKHTHTHTLYTHTLYTQNDTPYTTSLHMGMSMSIACSECLAIAVYVCMCVPSVEMKAVVSRNTNRNTHITKCLLQQREVAATQIGCASRRSSLAC